MNKLYKAAVEFEHETGGEYPEEFLYISVDIYEDKTTGKIHSQLDTVSDQQFNSVELFETGYEFDQIIEWEKEAEEIYAG